MPDVFVTERTKIYGPMSKDKATGLPGHLCLSVSLSLSLSFSLYFNDYFPGGPQLAGTRMSPFWILLELRVLEMVVTAGAVKT